MNSPTRRTSARPSCRSRLPVRSTTIAVNFGTACTTTPKGLQLDAKEVSRLLGGDVATWADAELAENNTSLAADGCTGAVTRVLRIDSSGTTEILKAYLVRAANERSGAGFTCAVGKAWTSYTKTNTEWPGKQKPGEEGTCSAFTTAATSGGPAEVAKLKEVNGGVGYADLPDETGQAGLVTATVQNASASAYQAPANGKAANCSYASVQPPSRIGERSGRSEPGRKELGDERRQPNEQNVTDRGTKYPICGHHVRSRLHRSRQRLRRQRDRVR